MSQNLKKFLQEVFADDTDVDLGEDYTQDAESISAYVDAKVNGATAEELAERFPETLEKLNDFGFAEVVRDVEDFLRDTMKEDESKGSINLA